MQIVTKQELIEKIETIKTSSAVSVHVETEVDMNKTNNPLYGAVKENIVAGLVGFDYEVSVNNQLGREDKELDFVMQGHKWAVPMENGNKNLLQNKARTKTYLRIKVQSTGSPTYFFNGQEISKETIAPYLKEHRKPHTQDNLDKEIIVRTYCLDNILSMKMLGDEYIVSDVVIKSGKTRVTETVREVVEV